MGRRWDNVAMVAMALSSKAQKGDGGNKSGRREYGTKSSML